MAQKLDLIGKRFGRLVVTERIYDGNRSNRCLCSCDCGATKSVLINSLTTGRTKSCGCLRKEVNTSLNRTHNMTNMPEYSVWVAMKDRCYNEKNKRYNSYGAIGIYVCDRWIYSFESFIKDMGPRPSDSHSLDRIDNNGPYSPENCRWADYKTQSQNQGIRKDNTSGVRGVSFHKNSKSWVARWRDLEGKEQSCAFAVNKYGNDLAFEMACKARETVVSYLNSQGCSYPH